MKKILSVLFIAFSIHAFACGGYIEYPRWSIGVIGVGNYNWSHDAWQPHFLPGIQLKRTIGKHALRFGVEHVKSYNTPTDMSGGADILSISGPEKRTVLRVGIERGWNLHRYFVPYVALDLAAQSMKSDITYSGGIMGMNERDEITTKGIGLLPTIGFKTFITYKVAFFAEYRAEAFINDVNQKTTYYNGNVDARPSHDTKGDFNFGSIGNIGVQFSF